MLGLLAPITPHITHALWLQLGFSKPIIDASWPKFDKLALKINEIDFVVQVNGKRRAQFTTNSDTPEATLIDLAKTHAAPFLHEKSLKKAIVVAHRQLINLVIDA